MTPRPDAICPPAPAAWLLKQLNLAGYAAYLVGGCVRDSLLGRTPGDWDICTAALPDQTRQVFAGQQLVLTGLRHGTVAVVLDKIPYEITTFRVEGGYADHRHPDAVRFVPRVEQDLARRDFTVNAMAWNPDTGLVDCFGGRQDLAAGVIRCVGDPATRFAEDALRILRAVRFAAQLDFSIHPDTQAAAVALRDTVQQMSAERIFAELDRLLISPAAGRVLSRYGQILAGALPEITPCIGCSQPVRWHCYDVWQHTAAAVGAAGQREDSISPQQLRILRWTMLLHDLAKPLCRMVGQDGAVHFPGHNQRGAQLAETVLLRLRAPTALRRTVSDLIAVHDSPLPADDPSILRMLSRRGERWLTLLCAVKQADLDAHAQNDAVAARRTEIQTFAQRMHRLAASGCYTLSRLPVTGSDAIAAGIVPGPAVGRALNLLLDRVMQGTLPARRPDLLFALAQLAQGDGAGL